MFPRNLREGETYIQKKSIERIGVEELIDAVYELKDEMEALKREFKSFMSRQATWDDLKTISDHITKREEDCKINEEGFQNMNVHFLRNHEALTGIIQGVYSIKDELKELGGRTDMGEKPKPALTRKKRGLSPSPPDPNNQ